MDLGCPTLKLFNHGCYGNADAVKKSPWLSDYNCISSYMLLYSFYAFYYIKIKDRL